MILLCSYEVMLMLLNGVLQIPFKRSGVQLSELLDTACGSTSDYYQTKVPPSGRKVYKRQHRRDGKPSSLKDVTISEEVRKVLRFTVSF